MNSLPRWLISITDMPLPCQSSISAAAVRRTSSGSTAGPALKLKIRMGRFRWTARREAGGSRRHGGQAIIACRAAACRRPLKWARLRAGGPHRSCRPAPSSTGESPMEIPHHATAAAGRIPSFAARPPGRARRTAAMLCRAVLSLGSSPHSCARRPPRTRRRRRGWRSRSRCADPPRRSSARSTCVRGRPRTARISSTTRRSRCWVTACACACASAPRAAN